MRVIILRVAAVCSIAIALHISANGQDNESKKRRALRITGKATSVVAKATAKATYETIKFTAKRVAVPAFKHIVVPAAKASPPIAAKAVKLTAKGIKNGIKSVTDRDTERGNDDVRTKLSN